MGNILQPPFLKFSDPADLAKITQIKHAIQHSWLLHHATLDATVAQMTPIDAHVATGSGPTVIDDVSAARAKSAAKSPIAAIAAAPARAVSATVIQKKIAGAQIPSAAPAGNLVTVAPSGNVPLGFNCERTFTATALSGTNGASGFWTIQYSKTLGTGAVWQDFYFLTNTQVNDQLESTIEFLINMQTYGIPAYAGYLYFRIGWSEYTINGWLIWYSDPVTLNFNVPPCNEIHHVAFTIGGVYQGANCSLVGAGNGSEPTLSVTLAAPAKPGGETVRVSSSNTTYGWIMNSAHIDIGIAAGQVSGAISWFLGTKKVTSAGHSFNLECQLVYPDGQVSQHIAHAHVALTKH